MKTRKKEKTFTKKWIGVPLSIMFLLLILIKPFLYILYFLLFILIWGFLLTTIIIFLKEVKYKMEIREYSKQKEHKFFDQLLEGKVKLEDIDNFIDDWHEGNSQEELYEFLGMSKDEYVLYVKNPTTFLNHVISKTMTEMKEKK